MDGDNARSPFITALLSLVILAIISLGIYAGLHYYQRRNADASAAQPTAQTGVPANPGTNDQTLPAQQPNNATPASPAGTTAASGLNVQIKAKGEDVWLRTRMDEESNSDGILAADQTRDFKPAERLSVQFSKSKAKAIEVLINGQPANIPTDAKGKPLVELLITKDGYEQLLQRP
jgi:hypothetical protein